MTALLCSLLWEQGVNVPATGQMLTARAVDGGCLGEDELGAHLCSKDSRAPQNLKLCGVVFRFLHWCIVYFSSWKPFNPLQQAVGECVF